MTAAGSMGEVIALEKEIMAALPAADRAAERDPTLKVAVRDAQDLICNAWCGPEQRLARLRRIASEFRRGVRGELP